MVLVANPNHASSGQRRACSTSNIDNESMAMVQCPSVLSAQTLMGHYYLDFYLMRHTFAVLCVFPRLRLLLLQVEPVFSCYIKLHF